MAIFDIFKKKEEKDNIVENVDKGVEIVQTLSSAYLDLRSLDEVKNLSFSDIESVGDAFNQIMPAVKAIYDEVNRDGSGLYCLTNLIKDKAPLELKGDNYTSGALKLASGKSVAAINPYVLIVMVSVVAIQKQTEMIHEECNRILTFLKNDKESQIEGDLATLNEIIEGYKYNWSNREFCQNNHKLALDIKRSSGQNIIFYQKQINNLINNQKKALASKSTEAKQIEFENNFKYYQMSVYINSYASYLEVLLLGNFDNKYLDSVVANQKNLTNDYQKLFDHASEKLELIVNSSAEAKALRGIGGLMQKTKKVDWFSKTGKSLENKGNKQKLDSFIELKENKNLLFVEKIEDLAFLSDPQTNIYFDKDGFIFCKE